MLLVLLDLSSAFDTLNHQTLLNTLHSEFGIDGTALLWFKSYLFNRSQQVSIHGKLSQKFYLDGGVPQGSCLGPLLFILYTSSLFEVIETQLPNVHCYADDTQLYLSFCPNAVSLDCLDCLIFKINQLQRVQNSCARLVCNALKYCHITPLLIDLHWLPVRFRIDFKMLLITYKILNGLAPLYLCQLIKKNLHLNIILEVPGTTCSLVTRCVGLKSRWVIGHLSLLHPNYGMLYHYIRKSTSLTVFKQ